MGPIAAAQASLARSVEPSGPRPEASAPAVPFAKQLGTAFAEANETLQGAEASAQKLAADEVDVVETMIALGRADLSLRFVVALRNRALEAYNEIMRLQV